MTSLPTYSATTKLRASKKRAAPGDNIRKLVQETGEAALRERAAKLSEELTSVESGPGLVCKLATARQVTKDGYVQLSGGQVKRAAPVVKTTGKASTTEQVNLYAHHLVVWARDGDCGLLGPHDSISHLCHHPDCLKEEHLVKEPMWKNIRRQSCAGPDLCTCDDVFKCLRAPSDE